MTIWSRTWNKVTCIWYDIHVILYKYWLHEKVTWEIVIPRKPVSTKAKPRLTLVFEEWQFACFICFVKHECNKILGKLVEVIRKWGWVGTFCNYISTHILLWIIVTSVWTLNSWNTIRYSILARLILYLTPPFLLANTICEKCWAFFFWLETYRSTSWIIKHRDCW